MKEKKQRMVPDSLPAVQLFKSQSDDLNRWVERRLRFETMRRRVVGAGLLVAVPLLSGSVIAANPVIGAYGDVSLADATAAVEIMLQTL